MLFGAAASPSFCSTVRRGIISRFCCGDARGHRRFLPASTAHLRPTASGEQHGTSQNSKSPLLHNVSSGVQNHVFSWIIAEFPVRYNAARKILQLHLFTENPWLKLKKRLPNAGKRF